VFACPPGCEHGCIDDIEAYLTRRCDLAGDIVEDTRDAFVGQIVELSRR
jgi:hypothetical protein